MPDRLVAYRQKVKYRHPYVEFCCASTISAGRFGADDETEMTVSLDSHYSQGSLDDMRTLPATGRFLSLSTGTGSRSARIAADSATASACAPGLPLSLPDGDIARAGRR